VLTDVVVVEVAALVDAFETATYTFRIGAPRLIVFCVNYLVSVV